jgi:general secretion pathway protein M
MIAQLSRREQIALAVGAVAVLATVLFLGVIAPYRSTLSQLDSKISARQRQIREVESLRREFLVLQQRQTAAEARLDKAGTFSLFPFVEGLVGQIAAKENLVSMRPQPSASRENLVEESVEVRLEKIRLDQVIRLLYAVDTADALLQVKNLRLKTRFDDRTLFDATMTVAAFGRTR